MTDLKQYKNLNEDIKKTLNISFHIYAQLCEKTICFNDEIGEYIDFDDKKVVALLSTLIYLDKDNKFKENDICINDIKDVFKVLNFGYVKLEFNIDENIEYADSELEKIVESEYYLFFRWLDLNEKDTFDDFIKKIKNTFKIYNFIVPEKKQNLKKVFNYYTKGVSDEEYEDDELEEELSQIMGSLSDTLSGIFGQKPSVKVIKMSKENNYQSQQNPFDNIFGIQSGFLEKNGTNLTYQDYTFNPAIGREDLIEKMAITLATPTKSVILIGMPGVGKTSVVQGLAKAIQEEKFLVNYEVIEINASSLVAGKGVFGSFEENLKILVEDIERKGNVILFIDEIQQIYEMGIRETNVMNIFKKPLSSGKLKIIGSTTKKEYDETLKQDSAFVDRFDTFFVEELKEKELKQILYQRIEFLKDYYKIDFSISEDNIISFIKYLIKITDKENRRLNEMCYNPRLVIQILDTIFATAFIKKRDSITKDDIIYAIKSCSKLKSSNYKLPNIFDNDIEDKKENRVVDFNLYKKKSLKN